MLRCLLQMPCHPSFCPVDSLFLIVVLALFISFTEWETQNGRGKRCNPMIFHQSTGIYTSCFQFFSEDVQEQTQHADTVSATTSNVQMNVWCKYHQNHPLGFCWSTFNCLSSLHGYSSTEYGHTCSVEWIAMVNYHWPIWPTYGEEKLPFNLPYWFQDHWI